MSSCNCCFLTCIQVSQEAGQVIWYSQLFKNLGFDLSWFCLSYHLAVVSSLDVGYLFLVGSSVLLSVVVQQLVVVLVLSQEEVPSGILPGKSHRQRSLVDYVQGIARVSHNLVNKPPPPFLSTRDFIFYILSFQKCLCQVILTFIQVNIVNEWKWLSFIWLFSQKHRIILKINFNVNKSFKEKISFSTFQI